MQALLGVVAGKGRAFPRRLRAVGADFFRAALSPERVVVGPRVGVKLRAIDGRAGFDQQHFESLLGEHLGGHAASGAAADDQHIIRFGGTHA